MVGGVGRKVNSSRLARDSDESGDASYDECKEAGVRPSPHPKVYHLLAIKTLLLERSLTQKKSWSMRKIQWVRVPCRLLFVLREIRHHIVMSDRYF